MKKTSVIFYNLFLLLSAISFFILSNIFNQLWMKILFITFLTTFYHFFMRLCVGESINLVFKNKTFNQDFLLFKIHKFEPELYKKIAVKKWKAEAITANPQSFNPSLVSMERLLHNMIQAELVHEIIMVLSFIPLLFIIPFGAPAVFIGTSIFGFLIDLKYVIIQRYNRPRVIKIINREKQKNHF